MREGTGPDRKDERGGNGRSGARRRRRRPRRVRDTAPAGEQAGGGRRRRPRRRPEEAAPPAPDEDLVVVEFKDHRKSYYHNRRGVALRKGDYCVVDADRGRDLGRVLYLGPGPDRWWDLAGRQGVLARADAADIARLHEIRGDEWQLGDIAREKIQDHGLAMNLVSVERRFDHKKITFYFTAEKRVDFRRLVRDLAGVFRTRIELRQIGVRDEARLHGGVGVCGRVFCCSSFLHEFVPVTLKMAKVQQLPLNPCKLSGPCGRLRCCVAYEHGTYEDLRRRLPRVGTAVSTPHGRGRVRKLDLLHEQVTVAVPGHDGALVLAADDLRWNEGDDLPAPRSGRRGGRGSGGPRH